jgi:flavodoxin
MKKTIIYASTHHKNTEKIAQAINSVLNANLIPFHKAKKEDVLNSDLIGFASGIYIAKFHKGIIDFVDSLPKVDNKKAFIFSTAGIKNNTLLNRGNSDMRDRLLKKSFDVIGEFDCKGYDTYSFLKLIGGINKGRPNSRDIEDAKDFAREIEEKMHIMSKN